MKTNELMRLPWTVSGPRFVPESDGPGHWEIRILELPDFFVAAETAEAAANDYLSALRSFLESYEEFGETPPLPTVNRWVFKVAPATRPRLAQVIIQTEQEVVTA